MVDVRPMHSRASPLAITFYVAFALWFTAMRYGSPSFYGWLLTPFVSEVLVFCTVALFLAVVILIAWRGFKASAFPRADAVVAGSAIVCFDLVWRFNVGQFAGDTFKLISIALDIATPAIAILGIFVVVSFLKRSVRVTKGDQLVND